MGLRKMVSEWSSRRRLKKLAGAGKVDRAGAKKKGTVSAQRFTRKSQKNVAKILPGAEKTGKVGRKAVGAVATKGGVYAKYKKGSKDAKSFKSAFAAACKGKDSGTFTWQGRSYSCAKKK